MVTLHPLEYFPLVINDRSVVQAKDLVNMHNHRVKMVGWFMASKRIKTSKRDIMKFLSLEDLTGTFEAVLFPKVYERYAVKTLSMGPYVIEGRVDSLMGNNIIVDKLECYLRCISRQHSSGTARKNSIRIMKRSPRKRSTLSGS